VVQKIFLGGAIKQALPTNSQKGGQKFHQQRLKVQEF